MVTGPLRAMTQARLELIVNALSKGSGKLSLASGLLVIGLALVCLIPPFVMFMVFGHHLGEDLPDKGSVSMVWLATLNALTVFGLGTAAGLRQHRGFDRELLRSMPLRPAQLLLAELPFGLLDTIPLLGLAFFSGLATGLTRAQPRAFAIVLLISALGVLGLLLVQQLIGVTRRLAGRARFLAAAAGLAALPLLAMAALSASKGVEAAFALVLEGLPTTLGYHGLRAWLQGDTSRALGYLAGSLACVAALFVLTAWLQLKELGQDPPLRAARQGKENLWTFRRPSAGVARLFVSQVLSARYGKLLLILPFFATGGFVLCAVKIQYVAPGSVLEQVFDKARTYPLYALVPPCVVGLSGGLWLNQFAWEGQGVKTLLLAPIGTAEILQGKLLGLVSILLPLSLAACLPLAILAPPTGLQLAQGAALALFVSCVLGSVGQVFSARFPRRLAEAGTGVQSAPFTLQLMSTALLVTLAGLCFGVALGLEQIHPWAAPAGFALLSGLALLLRRAALPRLSTEFDACREGLSEALS